MDKAPIAKNQKQKNEWASVQACLPTSVAHLLQRQPLSDSKIKFAWSVAVGRAINRTAAISLKENGLLEVHAKNKHWHQEIARSIDVILARMNNLLGSEIIKNITIRHTKVTNLSSQIKNQNHTRSRLRS